MDLFASECGSLDVGNSFFFFFTLVTGPRRSLSRKLCDTRVFEPQIRARLVDLNPECGRVPRRARFAHRLFNRSTLGFRGMKKKKFREFEIPNMAGFTDTAMIRKAIERLVIYCQTTGVSAAHATHCATYCTPCRPFIRAFPDGFEFHLLQKAVDENP